MPYWALFFICSRIYRTGTVLAGLPRRTIPVYSINKEFQNMDGKWVLLVIGVLFLFCIVAVVIDSLCKKKENETEPEPYVPPRAGEVSPRYWATSSFAPSIFLGMSPTIYFVCGACRGENQLKVPMATVPYDGGLRLRCQCCGKPNRLPIRRC